MLKLPTPSGFHDLFLMHPLQYNIVQSYAVVEPGGGATGSRINGSHGSDRVRMRNQNLEFPALFSGVLTGNDVTRKAKKK
jgi:hypothetical protein